MNNLELRPSYWASVSGGKDSLYMLKLILENADRYPLDGVCHFELEIDFPFIKDVVDYMEMECKKHGIMFIRIKPRNSWYDLYKKWGMPSRVSRWCNSVYKLDAKKQLDEFMFSRGCYVVSYIGYCADEVKRYEKRQLKAGINERYPLVDFGIQEDDILKWAATQSIFNNYYKINRRCGCMFCPMMDRMSMAYLLVYYPEKYSEFIEMCRESEKRVEAKSGKPHSVFCGNAKYNADYVDNRIRSRWIQKLYNKEKGE